MKRTWKLFGMQALLAAILLAAPSRARAADPEKEPDLKDIVRRLELLEKGMKAIQEEAAAIREEGLKIKVLKDRIDKMVEQLGLMQPILEALQKQTSGKESVRVAKAAPEVGRILLTNRYTEEITFVLNNRDVYTVLPGKALQVEGYPAGVFTYQIQSPTWGARDRVTSTLPINETVRLTVD